MNGIAQPALLYLVPFTVIPPVLIAVCRNELKELWIGPGDGSDPEFSSEHTPDKTEETVQENNSLLEETGDVRTRSSNNLAART